MKTNNNFKIAQIIQQFLPVVEDNYTLSGHQRSTLKLMRLCKTAALGGHVEQCLSCSHRRFHYNSCGNRHCPSCQGAKKEQWIFDRQQDLLPVKYYHCVFTIPSELYPFFRYNKKLLYDLFMRCVKDTVMDIGKDPKHGIGGKIGGINLLHTWTQQMTYHPHVHVIVPAGGLTSTKSWKHAKNKGNFLFPVKVLSRLFRGKLLAQLHTLFKQGKLQLPNNLRRNYYTIKNKVYNKEWVVYAKKAFGGPDQVLEYLGRYTHRICISNYRILNVTDTHVTFQYLDRKKKKVESKTITGIDFIKLFAEHILPKGFVKIRHFGFLSSRTKKSDLASSRKSLAATPPEQRTPLTTRQMIIDATGSDPYLCPICQKGEMAIISMINPIRGSPDKIPFRSLPKDRIILIGQHL